MVSGEGSNVVIAASAEVLNSGDVGALDGMGLRTDKTGGYYTGSGEGCDDCVRAKHLILRLGVDRSDGESAAVMMWRRQR